MWGRNAKSEYLLVVIGSYNVRVTHVLHFPPADGDLCNGRPDCRIAARDPKCFGNVLDGVKQSFGQVAADPTLTLDISFTSPSVARSLNYIQVFQGLHSSLSHSSSSATQLPIP